MTLTLIASPTFAADKKLDIVIIGGDDIGQSNISTLSPHLFLGNSFYFGFDSKKQLKRGD
jgi:hypothetical protein